MELENNDYPDIETFYEANSDVCEYLNILRVKIMCPRVFLKREPNEKWHKAFNLFYSIFSNPIAIQFITEEYSCSTYKVEYVNKANRSISNLQRQIIKIMNTSNSKL
ncbi:ATP-dependent DNA helicase [Trichonephila clavata]|uniref:ATP-dependent DNA helicase n=1 Tax=Trichonephila clavata TaxID=2740835 RepID=A0A8X6JB04_TRICU|nr:ATP-dependent DNA helicase [Trichonephila clavata]